MFISKLNASPIATEQLSVISRTRYKLINSTTPKKTRQMIQEDNRGNSLKRHKLYKLSGIRQLTAVYFSHHRWVLHITRTSYNQLMINI